MPTVFLEGSGGGSQPVRECGGIPSEWWCRRLGAWGGKRRSGYMRYREGS